MAILLNQRAMFGKEAVKEDLKQKGVRPDEVSDVPEAGWSRNTAMGILGVVTIGLAFMSEILTDAIEPASRKMGHLTPLFAGVFLLATVGNVAQLLQLGELHPRTRWISRRRHGGSSIQVALWWHRCWCFAADLRPEKMDLLFSHLELIAIVMAIYLTRNLTYDGESSWLEGLMLVAVYLMFGFAFYYHPRTELPGLNHRASAGRGPPLSRLV